MNRIDRLTAILVQLQSKKIVKAAEIAERFDISLRTVYRDIRALEEAGVPIGAEAGVGYFIMDGYFLPPVMFTEEEANSMLLAAKLVEELGDRSVSEEFQSALFKVKSVLKSSQKENLDSLNDNIYVSKVNRMYSGKHISKIQNAIVGKKTIVMKYFSNYNEKTSEREIEPIGLFYYSNAWHLIAFCKMRKDYRDFRVDRIKDLQVSDTIFVITDRKSLKQYIKTRFDGFDQIPIKMKIENEFAKYIVEQKYYYGFVDEIKGETETEMTFLIPDINYFARWVLMFAGKATVISPKKLITRIAELTKELQEKYL